jgi:hypothetical protein
MSLTFEPLGGRTDEDEEHDAGRKIYGVVTGYVLPHLPDPLGLGRIPVQLPCIDSLDQSAFARIATPMAGPFHGSYFVPNPGDHVLVAFENGDVRVPYIIGCLWNAVNRPPVPFAELQIRTIRTLAGNQIVFTEVPPTITIQTATPPAGSMPLPPSPVGPHSTVMLTPAGIDVTGKLVSLRCGTNNVVMGPEGISIQAGTSVIKLGSEGITIAVGPNMIVIGASGILIKGNPVNINPV